MTDMIYPVCVRELNEESDPSYNEPYYSIFVIKGKVSISVDFVSYFSEGMSLLFLSPYQHFAYEAEKVDICYLLQFHGDFYCIEYHKKEVACNGLLFNNIYLNPYIEVQEDIFREIVDIIRKIKREMEEYGVYSDAVVRSYLQLILALASKEKNEQLKGDIYGYKESSEGTRFKELLEEYFMSERAVSFYAERCNLSADTFSKKVKQQYGKTPIQLIQERVILEAKKMLHLSYQSIKEVAVQLHFEDEFYFSRYFKKAVGLSPKHYRDNVGISIVAKKSME